MTARYRSVVTKLEDTRRALHAIAELVLAGPQYRESGEIALRVTEGGFETRFPPGLRVSGLTVVSSARGAVEIDGRSCRQLGAALGVEVGVPAGLYHDGSGVGVDDPLTVGASEAAEIVGCFTIGDAALRRFAPDEEPILWPEHFDVGISVAEVNYGVSPGDRFLAEPYAYVGPWQRRQDGAFWNAPFGAARPVRGLATVDAVVAFFATGRDRVVRQHTQ